jgi:hypothetical protein
MNTRSIANLMQDNPLGLALGAVCGFLLFVLLVLMVVSALPLSTRMAAGGASDGETGIELPQLAENKPVDSYYVINERPLFNESRLPIIEPEEELDPMADVVEEEEVDAPEVELSGVVITPSLRMVTLRRKGGEESLVAFEGRPIEAEFGSWQVTSIGPRVATLTSASGEELLLEMKVHDERIEQPEKPVRPTKASAEEQLVAKAAQPSSAEGEPLSRAEEIRQRIAERREELRRESAAADQDQEAAPPDYQSAIENMMNSSRRNRNNKQDEE